MRALLLLLAVVCGASALPINSTEESPLWTRSGKFEGDIALTPDQENAVREGRNGLINVRARWPDRTIPYRLRNGDFNAEQVAKIQSALEQFNTRTCVRVREATSSDIDYVLVTREDTGCWSYLGRLGGSQQLNLQDNSFGTCLFSGTIVHEFLHSTGFVHQEKAPERDEYITFLWDNIQSGVSGIDKYPASLVTNFGVEYDYSSVMHSSRYAFSKNGMPTMIAKKDPDIKLGNNVGLSEKDILKLNRMYGCI